MLERPQSASFSSSQIDVAEVFILLASRRRFIFWFTLGAALVAAIIVWLIPNQYTATAVILPPQQNSSMSSALLGQLGGSGALASMAGSSLGIKNSGDMYVSLFRSRTVEDVLIERFGLMKRYGKKTMYDTRNKFEDRTTVILGVKDGLIRVTATDPDPKFAAELANAYVEEFHKHSDSLTLSEASQRRGFFQQQLLEANGNLATAEEALKNTEQSTGVLQLDSQAKALIESAAILRAQVTAKEVQLQSMRSFATADNPQFMQVQQQLDALKGQLAKVAGPSGSPGADIGISGSKIPQAGIAYVNSLRDVRYYETVVELVARQFELAKLDEARQGTIQVSDVAVAPDKKSWPPRAILISLITVLAFFSGCGWAVFDSNRRTAWQSNGTRLKAEQ